MFYTFIGFLISFFVSYCICKIFNINFKKREYLPSEGTIITGLCTIIGSSIGLGLDLSQLLFSKN